MVFSRTVDSQYFSNLYKSEWFHLFILRHNEHCTQFLAFLFEGLSFVNGPNSDVAFNYYSDILELMERNLAFFCYDLDIKRQLLHSLYCYFLHQSFDTFWCYVGHVKVSVKIFHIENILHWYLLEFLYILLRETFWNLLYCTYHMNEIAIWK